MNIPRRKFVGGGLAGLATLVGCPRTPGVDAGDAGIAPVDAPVGDAAAFDGALRDSASSADGVSPHDALPHDATGDRLFRPRRIPPAPPLRSLIDSIGSIRSIGEADENGLRLPPGFRSRVVARSGQPVAGSVFVWPSDPDGASTFATEDGGWIYTANSEPFVNAGASSLRFSVDGTLVGAYSVLHGTSMNCSGGATPWHTWLSCEEVSRGQVYECDPWGEQLPVVRPALGTFRHEAVAVDPVRGHLYMTEDISDGALYRFVPAGVTEFGFPDLRRGRLECAVIGSGGGVSWANIPDPSYRGSLPTRYQVPGAFPFNGGEGIYHHDGLIHFSTKGDDRIWTYDIGASRVSVLYDAGDYDEPPIQGVDAVVVSCCGDVLVGEDLGQMRVAAALPDGRVITLVQFVGHVSSEVTGLAFDPSGTRLYFSSQRGENFSGGITYEVSGPFHEPV